MRISNSRLDRRVWYGLPGSRYRLAGIRQVAASVVLGCLWSSVLCVGTYAQEAPARQTNSTEKAQGQVCSDPTPETSGSHVFRRLGETFDIPLSVGDCQPIGLVLQWSNGRNNGSLLNVTFLDGNNQPIASRGISVFQQGLLELPFASLDPRPWFAAPAFVGVPAMVVIQTAQPFASPAVISYTVTRRAARVRSRPQAPSQAVVQPAVLSKSEPASAKRPTLDDQVAMKLRTAEGRLLSEGQGSWTSASGDPVRYKLKELRLPEPREMEIQGRREIIEFAYRLTLSSAQSRSSQRVGTGQVPSLSKFGLIWLDDAALPAFSLDSQETSTLIYDRSVLRDGAQISLSNSDGSNLYSLVEPFRYQSTVAGQPSNPELKGEEGNEVVSIKSAVRVIGATRMPLVQIELRTDRPFPPGDSPLQLQVGKRFFLTELTGDYTGRALTLTLTQEMFAELTDGAAIVAFFGKPDRSGFANSGVWYFGKLDKSKSR
jgi:hypothetical protein